MNEFDNSEVFDTEKINYSELDFLRKNTKLGPNASLKIKKARIEAEKYRKWYYEIEHELLETDYSLADELEYELRWRAWEKGCFKFWKKYGDGLDLTEFAKSVLNDTMNEQRSNRKI